MKGLSDCECATATPCGRLCRSSCGTHVIDLPHKRGASNRDLDQASGRGEQSLQCGINDQPHRLYRTEPNKASQKLVT